MFEYTLLPGKSTKCYIFWVCICSLSYPVCNTHALDCHLYSLALPYFSSLSLYQHDFWKKIFICILSFCTSGGRNISHSKDSSARYYHNCTYIGLHVKYCCYSCQILMKLEFSWQSLKKLKCRISLKSVCWGPCCIRRTDRQTDRYHEDSSCSSQFSIYA